MKKIELSVNPLAEFLEATESRKNRIIAEQLNPDKRKTPYYQIARNAIIKCILNYCDDQYIAAAIVKLQERPNEKWWHQTDQSNSISALNNWRGMSLPDFLLNKPLELVTTKAKHLPLYGVQIKVSPSGIFRVEHEGKKYLGAFKIHIAKGKPFNNKQSALVAQLLNQFLSNFVAEEDDIVHPRLCFCIDPFSGSVITASSKMKYDMRQLSQACQEIYSIWDDKAGSIEDTEVA